MEEYMTIKNQDRKRTILFIVILHICLATLLSACDDLTSCKLQAVAGGAQYCEELSAGE